MHTRIYWPTCTGSMVIYVYFNCQWSWFTILNLGGLFFYDVSILCLFLIKALCLLFFAWYLLYQLNELYIKLNPLAFTSSNVQPSSFYIVTMQYFVRLPWHLPRYNLVVSILPQCNILSAWHLPSTTKWFLYCYNAIFWQSVFLFWLTCTLLLPLWSTNVLSRIHYVNGWWYFEIINNNRASIQN